VLFDDAVTDAQAEARSFSHRFGGKKWVKNAILNPLRDAFAAVTNLDFDVIIGRPHGSPHPKKACEAIWRCCCIDNDMSV